MMLHSFQDNAGIRYNKSFKKMLAHPLLVLLVFEHGFIQIRFGIFEFFCFCFMSNKCFLMLLNFTRYLFSVNAFFLLMRNIRNECSEAATRGIL